MTALPTRPSFAAAALFVAVTIAAAQTPPEPNSNPAPPQSSPAPPPAAEVATMQAFGERDKACAAWTDDCRICRRSSDGVACSNISIACQPKDIRCTSRAGEKGQ